MSSLISRLKQLTSGTEDTDDFGRRALVTGSVAAGALLTGAVLRALRKREARDRRLAPALSADVQDMEIMEGRYRFYAREGTGVPVVLLHSINAAASSYEMKPVFEHLVATTARPVYALDWVGFGLSDRPPVDYRPSIFLRQLRRFLSERIHQPADVVAYSLGCEYAALTARSHPFLFRRLVLICPTGLSADKDESRVRRTFVHVAESSGLFEIAYRQLTQPEALKRFYQRQIFRDPALVPDDLVDYARQTSSVRGAHHAPSNFIAGDLFSVAALEAYATTVVPTMMIVPESFDSPIQSFELLDEVTAENPRHISVWRSEGGLMPQFEARRTTQEAISSFLS